MARRSGLVWGLTASDLGINWPRGQDGPEYHHSPATYEIAAVSKHVKQTYVKVGFNKEDAALLRELARRESNARKDPELGVATIVREYAMLRAQARLAELQAADAAAKQQQQLALEAAAAQ